MSFVEQEDVLKTVEPIFYDLFKEFGEGKKVNNIPFPRIKYKDSFNKYGTDKPDLRNPIELVDVTEIFKSKEVNLKIFKDIISKGRYRKSNTCSKYLFKTKKFF